MNTKRFWLVVALTLTSAAVPASAVFADDTQQAAPSSGDQPAAASTSAPASQPPVLPGPLLSDRKALYEHIQEAGRHGIGTANYNMAFKSIEDQVGGGASEQQIKPRVEQLSNALKDQLQRAKILKTQRPVPTMSPDTVPPVPADALAGGGAPAPTATPTAPVAGASKEDMMRQMIKDRLGGMDLPDGWRDKLMNSDRGRELLKKFGM